jgi:hypothetical protein
MSSLEDRSLDPENFLAGRSEDDVESAEYGDEYDEFDAEFEEEEEDEEEWADEFQEYEHDKGYSSQTRRRRPTEWE